MHNTFPIQGLCRWKSEPLKEKEENIDRKEKAVKEKDGKAVGVAKVGENPKEKVLEKVLDLEKESLEDPLKGTKDGIMEKDLPRIRKGNLITHKGTIGETMETSGARATRKENRKVPVFGVVNMDI